MKVRALVALALSATVVASASAQQGRQITAIGSMDVNEGGSAYVLGNVLNTPLGAIGRFTVNFDSGQIRKVWMESFEDFFANHITGALSGKAFANVVRNGRVERVPGFCVVMVDDLDLLEGNFPDQFFLHFTVDGTGEVIVRHGLMTTGDIKIIVD